MLESLSTLHQVISICSCGLFFPSWDLLDLLLIYKEKKIVLLFFKTLKTFAISSSEILSEHQNLSTVGVLSVFTTIVPVDYPYEKP